jgi:hypothetical protein
VENRNGLIVNTEVFEANGTAERDAALVMLEQITGTKRVTVGGDKGYDTGDFVAECRNLKVTPHVTRTWNGLVGVRLMLARRSTRDMPSARGRGSALKSASDGRRRSRYCGRFGIVESSRWDGSSPSRQQLIIWSACGIWRFKRRKPRPQCVQRLEKRSARRPKSFPKS